MNFVIRTLCPVFALGLSCAAAFAQNTDWRQFRGPGGQGVSAQTGLPTTWSADQNIIWKTALPGYGSSSPITVGNQIFLTCYTGYGQGKGSGGEKRNLRLHVLCLDRNNGTIKWDKSIPARQPPKIDNMTDYVTFMAHHGYSSSTPVSDGNAVYTFFADTGVIAHDLSGRQLWTASVGTNTHGFGSGASPVLSQNLLIVNASIESESLVALDKATGREVWRLPEIPDAWNTPVLADAPGGKKELVVITKAKLLGVDPATGHLLWNAAGSKPPRYICPSATTADGIIYAVHGFHGPAMAVRAGGRGDVSAHQLWAVKKGSNVSSPVYHDGHLYWFMDHGKQGFAVCVDAKSGKVAYQELVEPAPGAVYASPLVADGKIYYLSRKNGAFVIPAQPKFQILAQNVISTDDTVFNASPVVSGKAILLRSDKFLYCIGNK